jgi:hypothetical protein
VRQLDGDSLQVVLPGVDDADHAGWRITGSVVVRETAKARE